MEKCIFADYIDIVGFSFPTRAVAFFRSPGIRMTFVFFVIGRFCGGGYIGRDVRFRYEKERNDVLLGVFYVVSREVALL